MPNDKSSTMVPAKVRPDNSATVSLLPGRVWICLHSAVFPIILVNVMLQGDKFNMAVSFWYLVKSDLSNVHFYTTSVHWTSHFYKVPDNTATLKWSPCILMQDQGCQKCGDPDLWKWLMDNGYRFSGIPKLSISVAGELDKVVEGQHAQLLIRR